MKNILIFGMNENPGGVETYIMSYYRHLDPSKFHFDFLCNSNNKIAYEDEILARGSKTFHFPARSQSFFEYRKQLNAFFKENASKYDCIYVNLCSLANIDYLKLAKKYGIKRRIIHSHQAGNMDSNLRGKLHAWNRAHIDEWATDFWACSMDAARWFYKDHLLDQVKIISNAIDVKRMEFNEEKRNQIRKQYNLEDSFVIGNVGRLHFEKNQTFALDVQKEFLKLCPNAKLVIVGGGIDEASLKEKANTLGISDHVLFAGVQSNIDAWESAFDFFLFPSLFEGLGIALLEAQCNGLPVIASDVVIPKEAKVIDTFKFFGLDKSAKEWADQMLAMKNSCSRLPFDKVFDQFVDAHYEINHEVVRLEKLLME